MKFSKRLSVFITAILVVISMLFMPTDKAQASTEKQEWYYDSYDGGPEIYRVDQSGVHTRIFEKEKDPTYSDRHREEIMQLQETDEWIYFSLNTQEGNLRVGNVYRLKKDGSKVEKIIDQKIASFQVYKDKLYFITASGYFHLDGSFINQTPEVYQANLDGSQPTVLHSPVPGDYTGYSTSEFMMEVTNEWIYFIKHNRYDYDKNKTIYRVKRDGTSDESEVVLKDFYRLGSWTSSGENLAVLTYEEWEKEPSKFYLIPSGNLERNTEVEFEEFVVSFESKISGEWVYFAGYHWVGGESTTQLHKIKIDGTEHEILGELPEGSFIEILEILPNKIIYLDNMNQLKEFVFDPTNPDVGDGEGDSEDSQVGWVKENGNWVYYGDDGQKVTGWYKDGALWYYMDLAGVMQTGWVQLEGRWYLLADNGAMRTGWVSDNGVWYLLDGKGVMQTGWIQDKGTWYYLNPNGAMQTGWIKSGGKWFYLANSGAMETGWVQDGSKWYYMDSSGAMKTGWLSTSGKWYYLETSGAMKTGWLQLGTKWYYLNANGVMQVGSVKIGGKQYYFDKNGVWQ